MPKAQLWSKGERLIGINLDNMTASEFSKIKGKLKGVQDHILYDTMRLVPGAYAPGEVALFQQALGAAATPGNSATSFVKTEFDTNLEGNGGALPSGSSMVIESIEAELTVPAALNTTPIGTGSTINPTRSTDASSDNQVVALQSCVSLRFRVDQRDYERGAIKFFPSQFGVIGFAGATGTAAAAVVSGVASNSLGRCRPLSRPRHLESLQRFAVYLKNCATVTIVQGCEIRIALVGTLYTPVG
jgi:hypothetical protein